MKNRVKKSLVFAGGVFLLGGLQYTKMDVTDYVIHTKKVKDQIRICVLADLHCRRFGKKQSRITGIIDEMKPDLIVIPGDLFDIGRDYEISFELIDCLKQYPIYFTSGNHDNYIEDIDALRRRLQKAGVHVLENDRDFFVKGNSVLEIYGLSDAGRKPAVEEKDIPKLFGSSDYRVLISHRPDYSDFYNEVDCDLILSGHVHGGQWRIPFLWKGIYAPQQGLFPKYYQGVHKMKHTNLIISRGLASGNPLLPRLYNNPEICFVTLKPKNQQ